MGRLAVILAVVMTGGMQGQVANPAGAASGRDARIAEVVTVTTLPARDGRAAWTQTMDYYKPAGAGPHPAVVIVHGGGFTGGTSRNGSEAYCADFLAPAGYAVFSTNYRLAPGATFDDMVEDVQRAVRYVRGNAEKYGVDAGKIAVLGGSAGGYLSNRVGVEEPAAGTGTEAWEKSSDGVQAVVTLYGISDWAGMPHVSKVMELGVLGKGTPSGEDMSQASPIEHVRAGLPPFLLIHGDKDEAVPLDQSTAFADALKEKGDKAEVIVIPGGPHATVSWHTLPGVPDWEKEMTVWLNGVLGHTGAVGEGIEKRAAGVGGATVLDVGGKVLAPQVVSAPSPGFGVGTKDSGTVLVGLIVNEDGKPGDVRVLEGLNSALNEKAVQTVEQYRFKPATEDGMPVRVRINVEVHFTPYGGEK